MTKDLNNSFQVKQESVQSYENKDEDYQRLLDEQLKKYNNSGAKRFLVLKNSNDRPISTGIVSSIDSNDVNEAFLS